MNESRFVSEMGADFGRSLEMIAWSVTDSDPRSALKRLLLAVGLAAVAVHEENLFLGNMALGVINQVRDETKVA